MINVLMSRSGALIEDYAFKHLKDVLKPNMNVLVIGFSFFGILDEKSYFDMYDSNSEYYLKIQNNFKFYGIDNVNWLYYYNQSKEQMINLIKNADVIYFPGGAPDLMMERIIEKDILKPLKEFNKIVIGSSAGAMIQLKHYHISPDQEYFKYSEHKGLGYIEDIYIEIHYYKKKKQQKFNILLIGTYEKKMIKLKYYNISTDKDYFKFSEHEGLGYIDDFFIEVHYAKRKKQKKAMRRMRKTYLKEVYTIPDDGMLIVNNNEIKVLNSARKFYNRRGINK